LVIVVCGETLIDLVHVEGELWQALPGGSPANAAVALARLGTPTAMLARISSDAFGLRLRARLIENAVDARFVVDATEPTTVAVVDLDSSGGARYSFYLKDTADWQWVAGELPTDLGSDVAAIHTGSMALFMSPGGAVLESMLSRERANRVISIDPNVRASICPDVQRYRETVERWLTIAHIVKASSDDVAWLYPDRPLVDVLTDWSQRGPELVVFTRSGDGALARTSAGLEVGVGGHQVDVVDTIGAGDTFSAGLLHALSTLECLDVAALASLASSQLEIALRFAVLVSAIACTRAGADPPYAQDLPPVS
jgi:fructokinase